LPAMPGAPRSRDRQELKRGGSFAGILDQSYASDLILATGKDRSVPPVLVRFKAQPLRHGTPM